MRVHWFVPAAIGFGLGVWLGPKLKAKVGAKA